VFLKVVGHSTISINNEYGKVPKDKLSLTPIPAFTIASQPMIDRVHVFPIDIDLRHHLEFSPEATSERFDFSFTAWLLIFELVARESNNFQTLVSHIIIQDHQLLIVSFGNSSGARDIDNQETLEFVLQICELEQVSINVFALEPKESICRSDDLR
jgi:hypothetical protein